MIEPLATAGGSGQLSVAFVRRLSERAYLPLRDSRHMPGLGMTRTYA